MPSTMKFNFTPLLLLLGTISTQAADSDSAVSVQSIPAVQLRPPLTANNAQNVSQGFIGFGIEMGSFTNFGGLDQPNKFSNNLMSALSTRTGAPVHIRVGGTSMDNTIFNASSSSPLEATGDRDACKLHTNATIGSPWLAAFKHFNAGTRFTVQVPLARVHPNNRIAFAEACIAAIPGTTKQLDAIEIGNEPDLYSLFPKAPCGSPDRRAKYGPEDYAAEWKVAARNISKNVGALNASAKKAWYQAMTISSGNPHSWNVATTWNDIDEGGFVKTVSQHYYQADACDKMALRNQLMNHSQTVSEMQTSFGATIAFLQKRDIPFVLGEVGSAIGSGACSPTLDIYRSLGTALWTADFMLHSMAMGIARVSMQQGTGFNIAAWQPVTTPAFPKAVHGNWYGHVFAADFIGPGGNFQIHALPTNATHPDIVSYAGYNSGRLTKLAVLDMRFGDGASNSPRPTVDIGLPDLDTSITAARVSRLTAPGGSGDLQNINWAGKQWSADDDGKEPRGNNSVVVKVVNGSLAGNVTIWASQAILLEMIRA